MNEALKELEDTLADLAGRNLRLREENERLRIENGHLRLWVPPDVSMTIHQSIWGD